MGRQLDGCTDVKRVRVAFRKCFPKAPKNGAKAWIGLTLAREGVTSALRKRQHKRRRVLDDSQYGLRRAGLHVSYRVLIFSPSCIKSEEPRTS
jgi:hypothetical protein